MPFSMGGAVTPSLLLGGVLAVVFSIWTATNGWAFVLFLVAVFVLAYLPGRLLVGLFCPRVEAYERLILAVSLGLASSVAWLWLSARLGHRGLLWVWVLVVSLAALRRLRAGDLLADLRGPGAAEVALTGLTLAPFTWVPIYFRNLVRLPDGGWSYYPLADVTHHLAFANELGHSMPPQVPFLPGQPLNYHFGQDMLVALFAEVPGLGVPDVALRFVPTLSMALAVGALICLGRLWLGSRRAAWLLAALVILGGDWSFLPGLATGVDTPWVIHFFGVPTIVSMYLLNPMLPGVGLLCLTLLCLCRYCRGEGRAWGAGASLFLLALASVKVFAFAHALTALAAAALVQLVRWRRGELLYVLLGAAVPFAPVAIMDAASTGSACRRGPMSRRPSCGAAWGTPCSGRAPRPASTAARRSARRPCSPPSRCRCSSSPASARGASGSRACSVAGPLTLPPCAGFSRSSCSWGR